MTDTIAILGLGSIGLRHAGNLMKLGRRVVGFDPDPVRRTLLEGAGGGVTADRESAIVAGTAVVIATPTAHHAEDLAAVVTAGRHAFVEKPLAHASDAAAPAIRAAAEHGLVVFAGLMLRWHSCVERAKAALDTGILGRPLWARLACGSYLPNWRPQQDYRRGYTAELAGGGVLLDVIHEFDLAWHLLGPARTEAAAAHSSGELDLPTENVADVILAHTNGVRSALHLDYVTRPPIRLTEIAGSAGYLRLDLNARGYRRFDVNGAVCEDVTLPGSYAEDYVAEMHDFLECIDGRLSPRCGAEEALAVLDSVVAARRLCGLPE